MTYRYSTGRPQRRRLRDPYHELSEWNNFATDVHQSNYDLFMSRGNIARLLAKINKLRVEYGFNAKPPIWSEMMRWAQEININNCSTAYEYDTATLMNMLNERFIKENPRLYCKNINGDINVFRQKAQILSDGKLITKKYADFMPDDIRNMNVWGPVNIGISNEQQRYNNKFPTWQMNNNKNFDMSYETHSETLLNGGQELVQVPSGPNMREIHELNIYSRRKN